MVIPNVVFALENDANRKLQVDIAPKKQQVKTTAVKDLKQPAFVRLILGVTLNQIKKGDFYIYKNAAGQYFSKKADFLTLGLREPKADTIEIEGEPYFALDSIAGLEVHYDEKMLLLNMISAPELFNKNIFDLSSRYRKGVIKPNDNSAFVNYRLGYSGDESGTESFNLSTEVGLRMFDTLLLSNFSHKKTDAGTDSVRLMTNVNHDWRDDLTRLTIGDFFAFSGDLGSTQNLGGVSFSKRYAIDPYLIQRPTADLTGVVSTPSEADVYLDGLHLRNIKLTPGEFELKNINYYGGARDIRVVVKDAFGREQVINQDYYFASAGLREGLHEYSYNIGFVRQDYGLESNDYGKLATSAFHRYGVSDNLTLGLREESLGSTLNAGPQAFLRSNRLGAISLAASISHDPAVGSGIARQLGYSYQESNFSARLLWRRFHENYVTAGSSQWLSHPKVNVSAGLSYGSRQIGYFSIDHTLNSQYNGSERRSTNLGYNKSLFNRVNIFATLGHVVEHSATGQTSENNLFFGVSYYPSNGYSMGASRRESGNTDTDSIQFTKNIPVGEGWGLRLQHDHVTSPDGQTNSVDSYLQVNTRPAILTANYQTMQGQDRYQLSAAGAISYVAGSVGLSRPIYDSFGLVRLDGLPNVRVLQNNQTIGKTNAAGEVFVPNMGAYLDNQISIDDRDIPIDYSLKSRDLYVAPGWRSGSLIKFDVRRIRAVSGKLKIRVDNKLKPLTYHEIVIRGAKAGSDESKVLLTGKSGEFYIEDIGPDSYTGSVGTGKDVCEFSFIVPESTESFMQFKDIICEPNN